MTTQDRTRGRARDVLRRGSGIRVPPAVVRFGARQLARRANDPDQPWEVQRRRLDEFTRAALVPPVTSIVDSALDGVRTERLTTVAGVMTERTVVHFHGGGYCIGSVRTSRSWAAHLTVRTKAQVVLPEYRLAPEHPYPAALDDARAVMNALLREVSPSSIIVSGDSAGGGLALATLLTLRDEGRELPAGCILLSPWLELGADRRAVPRLVRRDVILTPRWLEACARAYSDPSMWTDPSVSPLLGDHRGLPPLLIQAGADDLVSTDADRLAVRASAAGVDVTYTKWPNMWHDFALQPGMVAAADSAMAQAAWFIESVTSAESTERIRTTHERELPEEPAGR